MTFGSAIVTGAYNGPLTPPPTPPPPTPACITDNFDREEVAGWGAANSPVLFWSDDDPGQTYVDGSRGVIINYGGDGPEYSNALVFSRTPFTRVTYDVQAEGEGIGGIHYERVSVNDSEGAVGFTLESDAGGTWTLYADTTDSVAMAAPYTDLRHVEIEVSGGVVRARMWSGATVPDWQLTASTTLTHITSVTFGAANSGALITTYYDNLDIVGVDCNYQWPV